MLVSSTHLFRMTTPLGRNTRSTDYSMVVAHEGKFTSGRLIEQTARQRIGCRPALRDGPLENSGAQIQAESRHAESCAQTRPQSSAMVMKG
jgi:hypothetical protein